MTAMHATLAAGAALAVDAAWLLLLRRLLVVCCTNERL